MKQRIRNIVLLGLVLAVGIFLGVNYISGGKEKVVVFENTRAEKKESSDVVNASVIQADTKIKSQAGIQNAFVKISKRVSPAVVTIMAKKKVKRKLPEQYELFKRFFDMPAPEGKQERTALGSGVIVNSDKGYILTNHHVIDDGDEINVRLKSGREYQAEIVGSDPKTDIAVLKIEAENLTSVTLGDSNELQVGEWVAAIGSPLGPSLAHSVTAGIVSAKHRTLNIGQSSFASFIQTDAAINPGNSGGPLVNINGKLVGVNTAIATGGRMSRGNIGIGFAIPINLAKNIMTDLIEKGHVERAWLGVSIQPVDDRTARGLDIETRQGALVSDIVDGSPAENSGLQVSDVIIEMNGKRINNHQHLISLVASADVGEKVELTVIRDGKEKQIEVELGKRPEDIDQYSKSGGGESHDILGLQCKDITPELSEKYGYDASEAGVIITGIDRDSDAAKKLNIGDIIKRVGKVKIKDLEEFKKVYDKVKEKEYIPLLVKRQGEGTFFVTLENE